MLMRDLETSTTSYRLPEDSPIQFRHHVARAESLSRVSCNRVEEGSLANAISIASLLGLQISCSPSFPFCP